MASVTIRVDDKTKAEASKIVEDFGFDLSSVTRAFYRQIVRENRVPLNLSYGEPNEESLESIAEAKRIIESGKTRFDNLDDMLAKLRS
ncbi:type II toxin-antitoxin system RelB/DinJ family antitoxin [Lancefieldella rimae]|uniref:type II toxin-antitoxin system RelB/DinJ family antitoxin n=1 Tax=Lancefieldella rimae TaxID=1383 RepID=UPI0028EFF868|nr:type II toxin-antitoxin system RelB/DinJ family antitoxin [Lancefieldella rimae]